MALTKHDRILQRDIRAEEIFNNTLNHYGPASLRTVDALNDWGQARRAYLDSLADVILSSATAKRAEVARAMQAQREAANA